MRIMIETSPLKGVAEGSPPCEALKPSPAPCGKPSVHRINGTCTCGNHGLFFTCESCYGEFILGIGACVVCGKADCVTVTAS